MKHAILSLLAALALCLMIPQAQAAARPSPFVPDELIIQFRPGTNPADHAAARNLVGAWHKEDLRRQADGTTGLELASLPAGADIEQAIRLLGRSPAVQFAEPNWLYTLDDIANDPSVIDGSLWGMYGDTSSPANQYGSQAIEAWAVGATGSQQVYIGIIDQGVQFDHPDLDANTWTNPYDQPDGLDNDGNGFVDDLHGWDFANNDNSVYDGGTRSTVDFHGTHIAGTIAAEGGNGIGVAGINWHVTIISAKFIGGLGGTVANAVKAINYLTDLKTRHGLNIVATNNSWGGTRSAQSLYDTIERARAADILVIAAAGNGGADAIGDDIDAAPIYPASFPNENIISVAAINKIGARAIFSNYGAHAVDIGAPGSRILSTAPYNDYRTLSGTSMATPHVTGAVALYAATHPGATGPQIKAALLDSAIPTSSMAGKTVTGGRLDVAGALTR